MTSINHTIIQPNFAHLIFVSPFEEGVDRLSKAFEPITSRENLSLKGDDLRQRIKHFVIGAALLMPIINIIIYLALRHFQPEFFLNPLKETLSLQLETISNLPFVKSSVPMQKSVGFIEQMMKQMTLDHTITVAQAYDTYTLHAHLFKVTKAIPQDEKIKEIWKQFLEQTEKHVRLDYPDGKQRSLDLAPEINLLTTNHTIKKIEYYQPKGLTQQELKGIREIEHEAFTQNYPDQLFYAFAKQEKGLSMYLARNPETKENLGTLICKDGHIWSLARRANAVGLGVARGLFNAYAKSLENDPLAPISISLEVRASNKDAIRLYEEVGFKKVGTKNPYYSYPNEPAKSMSVPCKTFIEKTKTFQV